MPGEERSSVDSMWTDLRAPCVRHVRGEARLEAASVLLRALVRLADEQLAQEHAAVAVVVTLRMLQLLRKVDAGTEVAGIGG